MNVGGLKRRRMHGIWVLAFLVLMWVWMMVAAPIGVVANEEDGGVRQHEQFEFEAFIKYDDITDGAGTFDVSDGPGYDTGAHNQVVRSWDTITYPLKVTINPKQEDVLRNIQLRISGTLSNGITDNRVNGKFAVGGTEDMNAASVSFVQDYTVEQTGNSIMIPIAVEVQGAKHGIDLIPDIQVQVMSVDGESLEGDRVIERFDSLPAVTTSSKVSIKPFVGSGLAGQGLAYYPYAGITKNEADKENMHAFAISWGVTALPGKTDIKGATFPDASGQINYKVALSGRVDWDQPARREALNFNGRDTPFMLLDQRPISNTSAAIGAKNTLLEGQAYSFNRSGKYSAPMSALTNLTQSMIDRYGHHMVWDSGEWEVEAPVISTNAVTYTGHNTDYVIGSTFPRYRADGYTGSPLYGVNERIFSSNSFLVKMPNEYRIGGPNNVDGKANNVYYRADVTLLSYTDETGETTPFTHQTTGSMSFTERNNPAGSMRVNHTFLAHPSNAQLGTPNIGDGSVSKGDASTIIGEDVRVSGYFLHSNPLSGGYTNVHRWNTDAFELTSAYARYAEDYLYSTGYYNYELSIVKDDREHQQVAYGVQSFTDNSFESFTSKGRDDYVWYDTYEEAIRHGKVGAMKNDVRAFVPPSHRGWRIPLKVNHANIGIGAETKNGTANVSVTNTYAYMDENRRIEVDVSANRAYHNPAIWDKNGTMVQKQSPSGSSVNFETLAVTPAELSTKVTPKKATYYNSETISWKAESGIVLPQSGVPDDLDAGVTLRHILPSGLDYKSGSGRVGTTATEPEIKRHPDGTKELVWTLLVSSHDRSIADIEFDTTINPFALSPSGVQSTVTVTSVIESELDQRTANLRTFTQDVTVLKVGMVGIYESIDQLQGDKNSEFTLTLSPYTTIEDEFGVTGLTRIPQPGDALGSNYEGTAVIESIRVTADRQHDEPVRVYVNSDEVMTTRPHEVDVTQGGWVEYTGDDAVLVDAVSVLFQVEGKMTNRDDIQLQVRIQTDDNAFGDTYLNETVINSATDYRLSPVSNRVRYVIRADLELSLERLRIYTDKKEDGLPVSVRVQQTILDAARVQDESITLALYDTDSGEQVTKKAFTPAQLARENALLIPPDALTVGGVANYEVRIEGYNDLRIWVKDGEGVLDADGYTATESVLTNADKDAAGAVSFTGVVMAERELGKAMVTYDETIKVSAIAQPRVKAGYGFSLETTALYHNELLGDVTQRTGALSETAASVYVDPLLMDETVEYYDPDADVVRMPMATDWLDAPVNSVLTTYQLPQLYLSQESGTTYSGQQKENGELPGVAVDAGNRLFVPTWLETLGEYDAVFKTDLPLGAHAIQVELANVVDVYAYMFSYVDSETAALDGLLIHPVKPGEMPEFDE